MAAFNAFATRDLLPFPEGDNSTDTVFANVHFNLTTLKHWNFTYYSNGTLSNGTKCWLTYQPYAPVHLFNNGSFVNATTCWSAVDPMGPRGYTGVSLAVVFGILLVLNVTALAKHGRLHLPKDRRFYPIGRRWQWYWGCWVCAMALISLFTNVDVDRYHVQQLPMILTVFFWFMMCVGSTAQVWEAVRHWGSWQERQYIDPNQFVYGINDKRSKFEFWLPLWFYFWNWMNFFLVVPRGWSFVEHQNSPEQTQSRAIPAATGARFKAAAFCLVVAWLTICYSLRHSIKYYKPRNRGIFNRSIGLVRSLPLRFVLLIPLLGAMIAYQAIISFNWNFSIMKADGPVPIIYGWGYGPSLMILIVQVLYAVASPNEDRELIRQRRERGEILDRELGIVKQPQWWRRVRGDHLMNLRDKIGRNVMEVGGERGAGRREELLMERSAREQAMRDARDNEDIEMADYSLMDPNNPRVDRAGAKNISPYAAANADPASPLPRGPILTSPATERPRGVEGAFSQPSRTADERAQRHWALMQDGPPSPPPPPYKDRGRRGSAQPSNGRSNSTETSNSITAQPQQVRSMLDI